MGGEAIGGGWMIIGRESGIGIRTANGIEVGIGTRAGTGLDMIVTEMKAEVIETIYIGDNDLYNWS
jgi:hypothetical protein